MPGRNSISFAVLVSGALLLACGPSGESIPLGVQRARVGAECFELDPAGADFGLAEQLCKVGRTFTLRNVCASPVRLSQVRVDAPAGDLVLTEAPPISEDGRIVAAGEEVTLGVAFIGGSVGAVSGELKVGAIEGASFSERSWTLSAETLATELHVESFVMPDLREQADLLVVIDNGPELKPLLSSVREGLLRYGKFAHSALYDARFAIALVSPPSGATPGGLVPTATGQSFVDISDPNWEAELESVLDAVVATQSDHGTLDAAIRAFEDGAFMRDGAAKAVLVLSATGDQSVVTAAEALNQMQALTATSRRHWRFTFNAVAPLAMYATCVATPEDGVFAWGVAQTNGLKETICTPGWDESLVPVSKVAFGFRQEFLLSEMPDLTRGPLRVTIDGIEIASVDNRGATVWQYYSARNAMVFEPLYAPEPGQTLEVTYPVRCGASL